MSVVERCMLFISCVVDTGSLLFPSLHSPSPHLFALLPTFYTAVAPVVSVVARCLLYRLALPSCPSLLLSPSTHFPSHHLLRKHLSPASSTLRQYSLLLPTSHHPPSRFPTNCLHCRRVRRLCCHTVPSLSPGVSVVPIVAVLASPHPQLFTFTPPVQA